MLEHLGAGVPRRMRSRLCGPDFICLIKAANSIPDDGGRRAMLHHLINEYVDQIVDMGIYPKAREDLMAVLMMRTGDGWLVPDLRSFLWFMRNALLFGLTALERSLIPREDYSDYLLEWITHVRRHFHAFDESLDDDCRLSDTRAHRVTQRRAAAIRAEIARSSYGNRDGSPVRAGR